MTAEELRRGASDPITRDLREPFDPRSGLQLLEDLSGLPQHRFGVVDALPADEATPRTPGASPRDRSDIALAERRSLPGQHAGTGRERRSAHLVAERRYRVHEFERRADGALASSSIVVGVPHTAITASPMNFSTTPP